MNVNFDSPDLVALVQDLVNASAHIVPAVRGVVNKGALNIKKDARKRFEEQRTFGSPVHSRPRAGAGGYLPKYAASIDYDVTSTSTGAEAEIGPSVREKNQGAFGPGIEYGSARHAPMPHLNPALDAEVPKFVDALADVAVRLLG